MNQQPKKPGHNYRRPDRPVAPPPTDDTVSADEHQRTVSELKTEQGRRRSKPLLVILLSLLLVGLGATAAIYVYTQNKTDDKQTAQSTTKPEAATQPLLTAEKAIAAIEAEHHDYVQDPVTMQAVKVSGYDFYTIAHADRAATVAVSGDNYKDTLADIGKNLKQLGFVEKTLSSDQDSQYITTDYTHADVICRVYSSEITGEAGTEYQILVGCSDVNNVKALAKDQQPFSKLLPASMTNDEYALAGPVAPFDSQTNGYKKLELGFVGIFDGQAGAGGAALLFYQTPDGTWKFFTGTQNILPCDNYNTDEIRKAYAGETCGEDQVVKP